MIRSLHIQNYALIKSLDIVLAGGVTAITGETGAGKSILVGAMGLLLGKRADTSVLFDKSAKCVIEAEVSLNDALFPPLFANHDLDYCDLSIFRREISSSGRSRAFVNDTPVNLATLRDIGTRLINIHSQHDTLLFNNAEFRYSLVDTAAGIEDEAAKYGILYREVHKLSERIDEMSREAIDSGKDVDYLHFQLQELEDAHLQEGEEKTLKENLKLLANAEHLLTTLSQSDELLNGSHAGILTQLNTLSRVLQKTGEYSSQMAALSHRIDSVLIELQDITAEMGLHADGLDVDENKLRELEARSDLLNRLMMKHQVDAVDELIRVKDNIESGLAGAQSKQDELAELQKELKKQEKLLAAQAVSLSRKRRQNADKFIAAITERLMMLNMPEAGLAFDFKQLGDPGPHGCEEIEWLFCANKGHRFEPLAKVASGGELSRLMLALKAVAGDRHSWPTLILDEIDTGISGETAVRVAELMCQMGAKQQLLVITHLPQIAGASDHHFHVNKSTAEGKTSTRIQELDEEARIKVLAEMISGRKASEGAVAHARHLLERRT